MAQRKHTNVPFLYHRVEPVPTRPSDGATYQRETIKNEGQ